MKKKHLLGIATFLMLCYLVTGCKPDDNSAENDSSKIYGTVTDFATGEPVGNANVQLRPSGETTLTGYDGMYEFLDVPSGTYSLKVTKEGYSDLIDDYDIVVTNGKERKRDVQIKKLPSSLHIYDNDNENNEISELDFGADEGVTQKIFNIFNGGSQNLQYAITMPQQAAWVSISQDQLTGTIGVNVTYPIIVTINRELLADGNNTAVLTITSATDGGKELTIKARKSSAGNSVFELPSAGLMVLTNDLGCVDWYSAKSMCSTATNAGFNDWRLPTKDELMTLYNNKELIGGFVDEKYWSSSTSYGGDPYYVNFSNGVYDTEMWENNHYHVRAVRTMESVNENGIIELSAANLMVQTQDLGSGVFWTTASLMCESSDLGGYTDWRLPTINELMTLYNNKELIGGFKNECYWSSTEANRDYSCIQFSNGSLCWPSTASVRAVRTLNGSNSTTHSFDFEDGWQGWQVIDADGDGNTWRRFYGSEGNIGHNGSVYVMGSESYINDVGALNPDNYLVSPKRYTISNGGKISFSVCAQDADYPAEHYGVAISTASTPTANTFVTIWEETLSAKVKSGDKIRGNRTQGNWHLKTINLSAYAGQTIWIAIRHFNCTDQFVINVDDITIVTGN